MSKPTKLQKETLEIIREELNLMKKCDNINATTVFTAIDKDINHMKDVVIFAFIGLVIAAVYVLIANMLDNTIKTEQDVEATTELLVLSSIPNYDVEIKSKRVR